MRFQIERGMAETKSSVMRGIRAKSSRTVVLSAPPSIEPCRIAYQLNAAAKAEDANDTIMPVLACGV